MSWISFTEAYQKAGVHKTSAERRLKALKERQPELYGVLVDDSVSPKLYKDPAFTELLKLPLTKVNKKKKTELKSLSKKQKRIKPRKVSRGTKATVEDIWQEPVVYTMDEETKKLYDSLRTEAERIKFEISVKILDLYVYSPLTLDQCCKQFGGNRHKFRRWCNEIEPIEHLYIRAQTTRSREQYDRDLEIHLQNVQTLAQGYDVTLTSTEYRVMKDMNGKVHRIPIREKDSTKHVSRNLQASIFWLTNKKSAEFRRANFNHQPNMDNDRFKDPMELELEKMSSEELYEEYLRVEGLLSSLES